MTYYKRSISAIITMVIILCSIFSIPVQAAPKVAGRGNGSSTDTGTGKVATKVEDVDYTKRLPAEFKFSSIWKNGFIFIKNSAGKEGLVKRLSNENYKIVAKPEYDSISADYHSGYTFIIGNKTYVADENGDIFFSLNGKFTSITPMGDNTCMELRDLETENRVLISLTQKKPLYYNNGTLCAYNDSFIAGTDDGSDFRLDFRKDAYVIKSFKNANIETNRETAIAYIKAYDSNESCFINLRNDTIIKNNTGETNYDFPKEIFKNGKMFFMRNNSTGFFDAVSYSSGEKVSFIENVKFIDNYFHSKYAAFVTDKEITIVDSSLNKLYTVPNDGTEQPIVSEDNRYLTSKYLLVYSNPTQSMDVNSVTTKVYDITNGKLLKTVNGYLTYLEASNTFLHLGKDIYNSEGKKIFTITDNNPYTVRYSDLTNGFDTIFTYDGSPDGKNNRYYEIS